MIATCLWFCTLEVHHVFSDGYARRRMWLTPHQHRNATTYSKAISRRCDVIRTSLIVFEEAIGKLFTDEHQLTLQNWRSRNNDGIVVACVSSERSGEGFRIGGLFEECKKQVHLWRCCVQWLFEAPMVVFGYVIVPDGTSRTCRRCGAHNSSYPYVFAMDINCTNLKKPERTTSTFVSCNLLMHMTSCITGSSYRCSWRARVSSPNGVWVSQVGGNMKFWNWNLAYVCNGPWTRARSEPATTAGLARCPPSPRGGR